MIANGDDLYDDATRNAIFDRIAAIEEEATSLQSLVYQDLEAWIVKHGVNMVAVTKDAEEATRTLKGIG